MQSILFNTERLAEGFSATRLQLAGRDLVLQAGWLPRAEVEARGKPEAYAWQNQPANEQATVRAFTQIPREKQVEALSVLSLGWKRRLSLGLLDLVRQEATSPNCQALRTVVEQLPASAVAVLRPQLCALPAPAIVGFCEPDALGMYGVVAKATNGCRVMEEQQGDKCRLALYPYKSVGDTSSQQAATEWLPAERHNLQLGTLLRLAEQGLIPALRITTEVLPLRVPHPLLAPADVARMTLDMD